MDILTHPHNSQISFEHLLFYPLQDVHFFHTSDVDHVDLSSPRHSSSVCSNCCVNSLGCFGTQGALKPWIQSWFLWWFLWGLSWDYHGIYWGNQGSQRWIIDNTWCALPGNFTQSCYEQFPKAFVKMIDPSLFTTEPMGVAIWRPRINGIFYPNQRGTLVGSCLIPSSSQCFWSYIHGIPWPFDTSEYQAHSYPSCAG